VSLATPWRRFPYALTHPEMAPPGVRGPFRLISSSRRRVVVGRPGLTVVFRRMEPHAAVRAFERGELDEAPVPQGEIRAFEAHPALGSALRARPLIGLDVVVLPATFPPELLRAYRLTVRRGEYQALISERVAAPAYGLVPGAEPTRPAEVRRSRAVIRRLPDMPARLEVPDRPELVEAAELVWTDWRQVGLPVTLVRREAVEPELGFVRAIARYPHQDGIYEALGFRPDGPIMEELIVPLGWVAEARLVSPRVRGWEMDELGVAHYTGVSLQPGP
jgi:hypothetical protein